MGEPDVFLIDIEKVFAEKNPRLAKRIPKFIYRYLKRILHVDEINEFLITYKDKKDIDFADAIIESFKIKIDVRGKENLPKEGRYIFVANHPMGALESMGFLRIVYDVFPLQVRFPVNDVLLNLKNFETIFVPINKYGAQGKMKSAQIINLYESDYQILFYPSGMVSRKIKGKITDLEWKKTFIAKAVQTKRDVVPIFIDGKNTKRFYRIGAWRSFFGIKANLEMFFLPDELYRSKNKTIKYTIGHPIPYETFDKSMRFNEWAEKVKAHVYSLKDNPDNILKKNDL